MPHITALQLQTQSIKQKTLQTLIYLYIVSQKIKQDADLLSIHGVSSRSCCTRTEYNIGNGAGLGNSSRDKLRFVLWELATPLPLQLCKVGKQESKQEDAFSHVGSVPMRDPELRTIERGFSWICG